MTQTLSAPLSLAAPRHSILAFRNHPARETRLRSIARPQLVGLPSTATFFWLGLLLGALLEAWTNVSIGFTEFPPEIKRMSYEDTMKFLLSGGENTWPLIIIISITVIFVIPFLFSALLLLMRQNIDLLSPWRSMRYRSGRTLFVSAAVGLGFLAGTVLQPTGLTSQFNWVALQISYTVTMNSFATSLALVPMWIVVSVLSWFPLILILRGERSVPMKPYGWFLISACIFLILGQLGQLGTAYLSPLAVGVPLDWRYVWSVGVWALFYWALAILCGFVMGRHWRRWWPTKRAEHFPTPVDQI